MRLTASLTRGYDNCEGGESHGLFRGNLETALSEGACGAGGYPRCDAIWAGNTQAELTGAARVQ